MGRRLSAILGFLTLAVVAAAADDGVPCDTPLPGPDAPLNSVSKSDPSVAASAPPSPPAPRAPSSGAGGSEHLRVAAAQIAPVWMDRAQTITKVVAAIDSAARAEVKLLVFGETLIPGYPLWLDLLNGAEFDSAVNKRFHAHYLQQAVSLPPANASNGQYPASDCGDLQPVCEAAARGGVAVYVGVAERDNTRSQQSLYASFVYITPRGRIASVHRKLMPTYEERLTWAIGDGHGLRTHALEGFRVGGLNCWENWMPLARASLYAQGETVHAACWPGSPSLTRDITRFVAKEGRVYVVSASAVIRARDIPPATPYYRELMAAFRARAGNTSLEQFALYDGGSCVAGPDGEFLTDPSSTGGGVENIYWNDIRLQRVREERQTFDPAGHYSRPDVTQLTVNRKRQITLTTID